ncbi:unnamed protein product [Heligmosomoides polygyrus]|uniref:Fibronectin type-III domain-containing protein n=1 Tax=Heligmosomoides polygyrus TaxID=6339 RepID=A0A3P7WRB8_HELPZ|nr:unnamed protein product [Heligmosomoides polygyrus]
MLRLLALATSLLPIAVAFTVLPYIQIDYAHYFHLAQCQAKCTEKYGVLKTRTLLDGSTEEFLNTHNAECEECESGCHQHRRLHGRGPRVPTSSPLHHGLRFWAESSADSAKIGSAVVSTVQFICQSPIVDDEFGETVEGFVGIALLRPSGPTRYIVQWKQRTTQYDETQWITASIEPDTFVKVQGLMPAVPLTTKNGYNSDRGVTAHVEWPRTAQDSCYYKVLLSNSSTQIARDITLDSSTSVVLPHLEFDTDYSLILAAVSADQLQSSKPVSVNFKSLPCRDVHGKGSLLCAPDPVSDLAIVVRPNGTGLISWKPSADAQNILFYQVVFYALSNEFGCQTRKETVNVRAAATQAEVNFSGRQCEYVVRLINYDLIGRDAAAEVRVLIDPSLPIRFDFALHPELVLIAACVLLLPFVCLLIRCRCRRRCPHRISEKQQKLADYV